MTMTSKMMAMVPALLIAGMMGLYAEDADAGAKDAKKADKVENANRKAWRNKQRGMHDGKGMKMREGNCPRGNGCEGKCPGSAVVGMLKDAEASKKLGLDEDTRSKILKTFEEKDAAMEKSRKALHEAMQKQAKLVSERADEKAVMKAVEEVGRYRTEIAKLQTRKMLDLRKSLSDEQIKKLEQARRQQFRDRNDKGHKEDCADCEKGKKDGKGQREGRKGKPDGKKGKGGPDSKKDK